MKFGIVLPSWDAPPAPGLARDAEQAGWDGVFLWEPVWGFDAWVLLGAIAVQTERIRLGTMITPLSRMRPWKLASETLTVDHLSNGRLILSIGLGAVDTGFETFGEVTDRKARAGLVDEGLEILTGLWRGRVEPYEGQHYRAGKFTFPSPPPILQQPRIPIWVVGAWQREKSLRRALRYDGLLPDVIQPDGAHSRATVEEVRAMRAYVEARRGGQGAYDIVVEGTAPGGPEAAGEVVRPYAGAGATWWIEADWEALNSTQAVASTRQRILQGPPRIDQDQARR